MSVRVALYQAQSGIDPVANGRRLADMIHASASAGARMLFTPEMTGLLDRDRERAAAQVAEEADDVVLAKAREAARHAGIWVHLGSLALKGVGDRLVNRSFESSRQTAFEEEGYAQELVASSEDFQEGLAAFAERRPPDFKGW